MSESIFISVTTFVQRNATKFLANKLGEEMVMMNMESGDFISMNNVGADIWELSEQPISVGDIIQQLLKLYSISETQCREETIQFLEMSKVQDIFIFNNSDAG